MPWYEWVFSGVGGAAAIAIIGFTVQRLFFKKQVETPSISVAPTISANLESVSDSTVAIGHTVSQQIVHHHHVPERPTQTLRPTEPSPGQIMTDLKALPPFERHPAQENYRGLSVLWPLALFWVQPSGDIWCAMFSNFSKPNDPLTIVDADFTELPPELKISPTDTTVWVRGRIREVKNRISLEDDPEIVEVKRP